MIGRKISGLVVVLIGIGGVNFGANKVSPPHLPRSSSGIARVKKAAEIFNTATDLRIKQLDLHQEHKIWEKKANEYPPEYIQAKAAYDAQYEQVVASRREMTQEEQAYFDSLKKDSKGGKHFKHYYEVVVPEIKAEEKIQVTEQKTADRFKLPKVETVEVEDVTAAEKMQEKKTLGAKRQGQQIVEIKVPNIGQEVARNQKENKAATSQRQSAEGKHSVLSSNRQRLVPEIQQMFAEYAGADINKAKLEELKGIDAKQLLYSGEESQGTSLICHLEDVIKQSVEMKLAFGPYNNKKYPSQARRIAPNLLSALKELPVEKKEALLEGAICSKAPNLVNALIVSGANPNEYDRNKILKRLNRSPLGDAVSIGNQKMVKILLGAGANPNGVKGMFELHRGDSSLQMQLSLMDYIIYADPDQHPWNENRVAIFNHLLDHGATVRDRLDNYGSLSRAPDNVREKIKTALERQERKTNDEVKVEEQKRAIEQIKAKVKRGRVEDSDSQRQIVQGLADIQQHQPSLAESKTVEVKEPTTLHKQESEFVFDSNVPENVRNPQLNKDISEEQFFAGIDDSRKQEEEKKEESYSRFMREYKPVEQPKTLSEIYAEQLETEYKAREDAKQSEEQIELTPPKDLGDRVGQLNYTRQTFKKKPTKWEKVKKAASDNPYKAAGLGLVGVGTLAVGITEAVGGFQQGGGEGGDQPSDDPSDPNSPNYDPNYDLGKN